MSVPSQGNSFLKAAVNVPQPNVKTTEATEKTPTLPVVSPPLPAGNDAFVKLFSQLQSDVQKSLLNKPALINISPELFAPQPTTFETEALMKVAAAIADEDGIIQYVELHTFRRNNPDMSAETSAILNFLQNNFYAIRDKFTAPTTQPNADPNWMTFAGVRLNDLRTLSTLDGNPKTIGIEDINTPMTLPVAESYNTDELIKLVNSIAGTDGRLVYDELLTFSKTADLSAETGAMVNFLLNNMSAITGKVLQMTPIPTGATFISLLPGLSEDQLRKVAALDGNPNTFGVSDLQTVVPPTLPPAQSFRTQTLIQFAKSLAGTDGQLNRDELQAFLNSGDLSQEAGSMAKFLLNNFQAIQEKLLSLNPLPPGVAVSLPIGIQPESLRKLAGLDGNADYLDANDLKVKVTPPVNPPLPSETFETETIIQFASSLAGTDGQLTRNELQTFLNTRNITGGASQLERNMAQFLLNNFQAIQEKLLSLNPLPPGVAVSLPIGIQPESLRKLAGLDGNAKTFGTADLKAPTTGGPDPNPNTSFSTNNVIQVINQAAGKDGVLSREELATFLKRPNLSKTQVAIASFIQNNFQALLSKVAQMANINPDIAIAMSPTLRAQDIQKLASLDGNPGQLSVKDVNASLTPPNEVQMSQVTKLTRLVAGSDGLLTASELYQFNRRSDLTAEQRQILQFLAKHFRAIQAKAKSLGLGNPKQPEAIRLQDLSVIAKQDRKSSTLSVQDLVVPVNTAKKPVNAP